MKAAVMIEALVLVQLWSLVVAGIAWVLQRDGDGRVGAHFPAPNIWLVLIVLSLLPGALYLMPLSAAISLPKIEAIEILAIQISDNSTASAWSPNFLLVYMGLGGLLISRTLWRWSRLQGLPLAPTAEPDIFTTTAALPPLTLSWPRRAVVVPQGLETQSTLIRHERAHLRHHDAELTLLLLLLQDMTLRNPGMGYLVQQWRLAIELRADRAATRKLTAPERKDYATLLLNIQRPNGGGADTLPCPAARLKSAHHRNTKIRLVGIIENDPNTRERSWGAALLLTTIGASGLGLLSAAASANDAGPIADDYVLVDYVTQTPLQMPT